MRQRRRFRTLYVQQHDERLHGSVGTCRTVLAHKPHEVVVAEGIKHADGPVGLDQLDMGDLPGAPAVARGRENARFSKDTSGGILLSEGSRTKGWRLFPQDRPREAAGHAYDIAAELLGVGSRLGVHPSGLPAGQAASDVP